MIDIVTFSDRNPEYIPLQYEALKLRTQEEYNYIVVNSGIENKNEIERICSTLSIEHMRLNVVNRQNATVACCAPINWYIKEKYPQRTSEITVLIDSDMFPIKKFSVKEILKDNHISGVSQNRGKDNVNVRYLWNGLVFINRSIPHPELLDFWAGAHKGIGCDVGGALWKLLEQPDVKVGYFVENLIGENQNLFKGYKKEFRSGLVCGDLFFHMRNGSNWACWPPELLAERWAYVQDIVKKGL